MRRVTRARLEKGEFLMVSLYRSRSGPLDVFIDPERGSDKTGDGSASKPFKTIKALERIWPKEVMP